MMDRLEQLVAVREAHLRAAQAQFMNAAAAFAVVERELAAVDTELRLIDQQRNAWETQWQQWLREDGVLCRGQEYNLYHLRLGAWEEEVHEQRSEVAERHRAAQDAAVVARDAMLRSQLRVDLLKREWQAQKRKHRMQSVNLMDMRLVDDVAFHGRLVRQAME